MISLAGLSFQQSQAVQLQQVTIGKNLTVVLYNQGISAGNPQPPSGDSSEKIDLNKLLITNEIPTIFCRVSGRSMEPHMRGWWRYYGGQKHWTKDWKNGHRRDQRWNDGDAFVTSRWLDDADRWQPKLSRREGQWLWRVDNLGSGHERDPPSLKYFFELENLSLSTIFIQTETTIV